MGREPPISGNGDTGSDVRVTRTTSYSDDSSQPVPYPMSRGLSGSNPLSDSLNTPPRPYSSISQAGTYYLYC